MRQMCLETEMVQKGLESYTDTLTQQAEGEKKPAENLSPRQTGRPRQSAVHNALETATPTLGFAATADAVAYQRRNSLVPRD